MSSRNWLYHLDRLLADHHSPLPVFWCLFYVQQIYQTLINQMSLFTGTPAMFLGGVARTQNNSISLMSFELFILWPGM